MALKLAVRIRIGKEVKLYHVIFFVPHDGHRVRPGNHGAVISRCVLLRRLGTLHMERRPITVQVLTCRWWGGSRNCRTWMDAEGMSRSTSEVGAVRLGEMILWILTKNSACRGMSQTLRLCSSSTSLYEARSRFLMVISGPDAEDFFFLQRRRPQNCEKSGWIHTVWSWH